MLITPFLSGAPPPLLKKILDPPLKHFKSASSFSAYGRSFGLESLWSAFDIKLPFRPDSIEMSGPKNKNKIKMILYINSHKHGHLEIGKIFMTSSNHRLESAGLNALLFRCWLESVTENWRYFRFSPAIRSRKEESAPVAEECLFAQN